MNQLKIWVLGVAVGACALAGPARAEDTYFEVATIRNECKTSTLYWKWAWDAGTPKEKVHTDWQIMKLPEGRKYSFAVPIVKDKKVPELVVIYDKDRAGGSEWVQSTLTTSETKDDQGGTNYVLDYADKAETTAGLQAVKNGKVSPPKTAKRPANPTPVAANAWNLKMLGEYQKGQSFPAGPVGVRYFAVSFSGDFTFEAAQEAADFGVKHAKVWGTMTPTRMDYETNDDFHVLQGFYSPETKEVVWLAASTFGKLGDDGFVRCLTYDEKKVHKHTGWYTFTYALSKGNHKVGFGTAVSEKDGRVAIYTMPPAR